MRADCYIYDDEGNEQFAGSVMNASGVARATSGAKGFVQPEIMGLKGEWVKPSDGDAYIEALPLAYSHSSRYAVTTTNQQEA